MHFLHYHPLMVTIHRIGNLTISVYADHAPPHFHVYGRGAESRIDLATMLEIEGNLPRQALAKAMEWALENQKVIEAEWNRLNVKRR